MENGGAWADKQYASVKANGESAVIYKDVGDGCKVEWKRKKLIKVSADEGIGVEVDEAFDAYRIKGPDAKFGVLVGVLRVDTLAVVGWWNEVDGVHCPACRFGETKRAGREAVWHVDEDHTGLDVGGL